MGQLLLFFSHADVVKNKMGGREGGSLYLIFFSNCAVPDDDLPLSSIKNIKLGEISIYNPEFFGEKTPEPENVVNVSSSLEHVLSGKKKVLNNNRKGNIYIRPNVLSYNLL